MADDNKTNSMASIKKMANANKTNSMTSVNTVADDNKTKSTTRAVRVDAMAYHVIDAGFRVELQQVMIIRPT